MAALVLFIPLKPCIIEGTGKPKSIDFAVANKFASEYSLFIDDSSNPKALSIKSLNPLIITVISAVPFAVPCSVSVATESILSLSFILACLSNAFVSKDFNVWVIFCLNPVILEAGMASPATKKNAVLSEALRYALVGFSGYIDAA